MKVYRNLKKYLHQRGIKISVGLMKRLDKKEIPNTLDEIRLFMMVRNEELRIPFLMSKYRELGVDRFFIVDNNSTDTTIDKILWQDNVHVFQTKESFRKNWNWIEWLLETFGKDRWCVVVDADELFVYPHYENQDLKTLCAYLDRHRQTAVKCVLVDMYAADETEKVNYRSGDDFTQACSFFDPWSFRTEVIRPRNCKNFKSYSFEAFFGGMRERVFGLHNCATKIPLLKYGDSIYLQNGMHSIDGATLSEVQGAVLHFKFFQDFRNRVIEEVKREEMWKKAVTYKTYMRKMESNQRLNFFNKDSLRYENSAQLQSLGFIKTSPEFESFVEAKREKIQESVVTRE